MNKRKYITRSSDTQTKKRYIEHIGKKYAAVKRFGRSCQRLERVQQKLDTTKKNGNNATATYNLKIEHVVTALCACN